MTNRSHSHAMQGRIQDPCQAHKRGLGKGRASPAVWQIELASLIFGKNVKNTHPTVWQKT